MCPSEQYETVCKGEFASVHVKLDKLDEAIRGVRLMYRMAV